MINAEKEIRELSGSIMGGRVRVDNIDRIIRHNLFDAGAFEQRLEGREGASLETTTTREREFQTDKLQV